MHRNKSVNVHQFAMVPKAEIPRSSFKRQFNHKTTFDANYLVPIFVDEVLPGDTFNLKATLFARMATPIYPVMDNLYLDSFFFFVPNRLVWDNWSRFMGQQDAPGDSISYTIPQIVSPTGGFPVGSLYDYLGLPTAGQVDPAATIQCNALPLRALALVYNEWFRDQNLKNPVVFSKGDGPDSWDIYGLWKRGKRHDYFTSCLPWTQKGGSVLLPIGTSAPVVAAGTGTPTFEGATSSAYLGNLINQGSPNNVINATAIGAAEPLKWVSPELQADLSAATSATINQLRQSFQIQKLLERDARGGTRYTEIIRAHFGVVSPDYRLQRPEYLGGGTTMININPVPQTSGSPATGGYTTTPQGNLAAFGTALGQGHGFTGSFTEHGYIVGIINARADLNYQQGIHRMWSRQTRYDFYFPAFAALGEQAVLSKEIFCDGTSGDNDVFGYQERWAEYRYKPSQITGLFRSTSTGTIDGWHLAQRFTTRPTLNNTFIDEAVPMERVLAVGSEAAGQHFILDAFFDSNVTRPMPMYSVPGLIDHF